MKLKIILQIFSVLLFTASVFLLDWKMYLGVLCVVIAWELVDYIPNIKKGK